MSPPDFAVSWREGVATVSFVTAQPKNSFRAEDVRRLSAKLDEAVAAKARCVVLRGGKGVFSAGWDIGSMDPAADDPAAVVNDIVSPFCRKLRELPVPTISAIGGVALGFGLGLALCCDIAIAEADACFGSPFRNIGMTPDTGAHYFFLSRLGYARACELIYTGRLIDGAEAARIGLVDRLAGPEGASEAAATLAAAIADGPTEAFRLSKEILLAGGDFDEVVAHEARQLARVFNTEDLKEGVRAFQERRKPVFQGR
jgi:enoyl-CoA hydratase/carnithine racemase